MHQQKTLRAPKCPECGRKMKLNGWNGEAVGVPAGTMKMWGCEHGMRTRRYKKGSPQTFSGTVIGRVVAGVSYSARTVRDPKTGHDLITERFVNDYGKKTWWRKVVRNSQWNTHPSTLKPGHSAEGSFAPGAK